MEVEDGSLTTGSCLYFPQKNAEFYPFLIYFDIILLVFLFSLMQVGGGMEAQIRKSSGASFDLVSKKEGVPFPGKRGQRLVIYLM